MLPMLAIAVLAAAGTTVAAASCEGSFLHGVASGDPLPDAIILWTRVTPDSSSRQRPQPVRWLVWPEGLSPSAAVASGEKSAEPERDFTVKVDVTSGLQPRVQYAYRFECGASRSAEGRFRLPPAPDADLQQLRFGVFSCADWQSGFFTAYRAAAREDLDFWLHLGDFIYEYPETLEGVVRTGLQPPHEIVSLDDYRLRHAHYRRDSDLQSLLAAAPVIPIWDDHELANNVWEHGAGNHQSETEGDFRLRKASAMRAYHDWMPTRLGHLPASSNSSSSQLSWQRWRRFDFGDLASVLLLETRLTGRTTQAGMTREDVTQEIVRLFNSSGRPGPDQWVGSSFERELRRLRARVEEHRHGEDKRMIDREQLSWFQDQAVSVAERGATWRLLAQALVMQSQMSADFEKAVATAFEAGNKEAASRWEAFVYNSTTDQMVVLLAAGRYGINTDFDGWMGYTESHRRITQALSVGKPISTVVYGGDSHNAWSGTVRSESGTAVAAEFDGMSVSSTGLESYYPDMPPGLHAAAYRSANPDLRWAETSRRGYMLVHLNKTMQEVKFLAVDVGPRATGATETLATFVVEPTGDLCPHVSKLGGGSSSRAVLGQTRGASSALQLSSVPRLRRRR